MFDKQIIEKLRHDLGFKDPGIFEKAVYALNLLPSLLEAYPCLIFKGGSSLLLHRYPPVRLSIEGQFRGHNTKLWTDTIIYKERLKKGKRF